MRRNSEERPPRSGDDLLAERALSALAEECEIPGELEERILARVLAGAPPVIALPQARPEPLMNVRRLAREDERRWTRIGWGMAVAAAVLLAVIVMAPRSPRQRSAAVQPTSLEMRAAAPAGVRGTQLADGHPRLVEARQVMFVVAGHVARRCNADFWSTVVRFERSGQATVLDVTSSAPSDTSCIEKAVAEARVNAFSGRRLAVLYEHRAGGERGDSGAQPSIAGWLVDET